MKILQYAKLLSASLAFVGMAAHASIVTVSGNAFDDLGSSTIDLATGIEWRDVNLTKGRTVCSIAKDAGGAIPAGCTRFDSVDAIDAADGWHFATRAEVLQLMTDWMGITINANGQTVVNALLASQFVNVFAGGETGLRPDFLSDASSSIQAMGIYLYQGNLTMGILNGDINASSGGSMLVRNATVSPVPEPAPLFLIGAGLAIMIARRLGLQKKDNAGAYR